MKSDENKFVDTMMYALTAPMITWPQCESIYTPENVGRAKMERLAMIMMLKGQPPDRCSDFEAALYISSWTLSAPPSEHWFRLYMHLFKKCFPNQTEIFEDVREPDRWELEDLERLKVWIFKQQMQAIKDRSKQEKPQEPKQVVVPRQYADLTRFYEVTK